MSVRTDRPPHENPSESGMHDPSAAAQAAPSQWHLRSPAVAFCVSKYSCSTTCCTAHTETPNPVNETAVLADCKAKGKRPSCVALHCGTFWLREGLLVPPFERRLSAGPCGVPSCPMCVRAGQCKFGCPTPGFVETAGDSNRECLRVRYSAAFAQTTLSFDSGTSQL